MATDRNSSPETAKARALRMLERRDYGRDELVEKLRQKGENPSDAEDAADRMVELGLIDDERYASLVARHYAQKGYGVARIKNELFRRRVPKPLWDGALEAVPEQDDTIDRLLRARLKGGTNDRAALKKATDALRRRGFGWAEISAAVERLRPESEE